MASTRELFTKDGKPYYEIIVSMGRGNPQLTSKWYPQQGWSKKTIERELAKAKVEFERKCKNGEILSRKEAKEQAQRKNQEASQIKTLKQYCESVFMPSITVKRSENTRASYQGNLNNWIYPALGDMKLPDITAANIESLLTSMQEKKKAHGTVIKVYTILKGIFKRAYRTDVIDRNPMDKVDRPEPRKEEINTNDAEAYTVEDIIHILNSLDKEPLQWRALIRLLIDTGIRRGECCGLHWKDVDFKENTITIRYSLGYTKDKGVYLDTTKNSKIRKVDVDPEVMELLKELRLEQAKLAISPYVFSQGKDPSPIHPQSPTGYLKGFEKKYGIHTICTLTNSVTVSPASP